MGIKRIDIVNVNQVNIPQVFVPNWQYQQPNVDYLVPPVVLQIGNPIVDMPGCVKAHQDNQYHKSGLPVDRNLVEQDPDKAMTVCDATVPSYDAMNYEPEQLIITREQEVPPVAPPPEVDPPEVPPTGDLGGEETPCPAPNQPRLGDLSQDGSEKVVGHEIKNGECVTLYEATTIVDQYVPTPAQVVNTAQIALIAATMPLLIAAVKPAVAQLVKRIPKLLGRKNEEQYSTFQKRMIQRSLNADQKKKNQTGQSKKRKKVK